jgi:pilus assembly protein CpaC
MAALMMALWTPAALAQDAQQPPSQPTRSGIIVTQGLTGENQLRVDAGKTAVLEANAAVTEISVGNPAIADINLLSPQRILVTGIAPGTTQLLLFTAEVRQVIDITVEADISGLRSQLDQLFPNHGLNVRESKGRIVITGQAPNLETSEKYLLVAAPYGEVLNLIELSGGQQIMLQVIFAEVSRSASTQLGLNFGVAGQDGFGASRVGGVGALGIDDGDGPGGVSLTVPDPGSAVTLFGVGQIGDVAFAAFLSALRDNNLMRVLARPNLVAISGESASFLAGGEFPIPVAQAGGTGASTVTVEFREFGVRLEFVALALGDGRIRLENYAEVSDLDFANGVAFGGFVVPGLTSRKVNTTVELADGQSLAIAGLLSHTITSNKSAVPLLGDVPVLGALFRSVRYQRRETELVVFVTPRLVSGLNPAEIPQLPGQFWQHPSEAELFFLGNIGRPAAEVDRAGDGPVLFYGPYGFNRAATQQSE